jgi:hypothetical protein
VPHPQCYRATVLALLAISASCASEDKTADSRTTTTRGPADAVVVAADADDCEAASNDPVFGSQSSFVDATEELGVCNIGFIVGDAQVLEVLGLDSRDCPAREQLILPFVKTNSGWVLAPDTREFYEENPAACFARA